MSKGLKPIVDNKTKILILGSFPSKLSLEEKEYYANPTNQFWIIISDVLKLERKLAIYKEKKEILLKNKIGLWDVIKSCDRVGSSDNAITNEIKIDLKGFLKEHPTIKAIFSNGRMAERYIKQYCINSVSTEYLPSSSSANAIPYLKKKAEWQKILNPLRK